MADLKTLYNNLGVTENLVVSERLKDAITDETGTDSLVFADSPHLIDCDVPTQTTSDSSIKIASTAFVNNVVASAGGSSIVNLSGTSQNMNLSSGTFFDGGELTGDTTLTFSNIPTQAKWTYTFETGWDVTDSSNVVFSNAPFSVLAQESLLEEIFFKPDGTRMYIMGSSGDSVYQYNLSVPWDVTTGVTFDASYSVSSQETTPQGIFFKPDGTRMYVLGNAGDDVSQYDLSVPWDVTTGVTFDASYSISGQDTSPDDLFFKPDGTRMYVLGSSGDAVNQYNLSVPWDVTTGVTFDASYSVSSQEITPEAIFFKPDGTRMYVVGDFGQDINQYNLSVPWDVTTGVTFDASYNVAGQEQEPNGIFFKPDGTRMYVIGFNGVDVNQYELFPYTISLPTSVRNFNYDSIKPGKNIIEFYTNDGGTNIYCNVY